MCTMTATINARYIINKNADTNTNVTANTITKTSTETNIHTKKNDRADNIRGEALYVDGPSMARVQVWIFSRVLCLLEPLDFAH